MAEILRQARRLSGVKLIVWPLDSRHFEPLRGVLFDIATLAAISGSRTDYRYIPATLSQMALRWPRDGTSFVVLMHLAATELESELSMGICADHTHSYLNGAARLIIGEVNQGMPSTRGPNRIPVGVLDMVVESDLPVDVLPPNEDVEDHRVGAIARSVAELVPDGATIEIGVMSMADSILRGLAGKSDLGIHSGIVGEGLLDLIAGGIVTNSRKPVNRGKTVAAILSGSASGLRRLAASSDIEVWPMSYTHDIRNISVLSDFVAINSCLQVDLIGQVYSESINGRLLGAVGGLADFATAASYAVGGKSIIATFATTTDGLTSKIVAVGRPGDAVTLTASGVDFVVTEYGVADLRGKSWAERGKELVRVAAPQFRDFLERGLRAWQAGEHGPRADSHLAVDQELGDPGALRHA
jgi:acyl-CoA hydrolase